MTKDSLFYHCLSMEITVHHSNTSPPSSIMKTRLQSLSKPTTATNLLIFLGSSLLWLFFYYFYPNTQQTERHFLLYTDTLPSAFSPYIQLFSFLLMIFNTFLIYRLINKYATIRVNTFLPSFIYLFWNTFAIATHSDYIAYLSTTILLLMLHLTFSCYKQKKASEQLFLTYLLLSINTILIPSYAIFIIPFWVFYHLLQSLSFRSFIASLLGFCTPWIFILFLYGYHNDSLTNFTSLLPTTQLTTIQLPTYDNLWLWAYLLSIAVITIIATWQISDLEKQDNNRQIKQHQVLKIIFALYTTLIVLKANHPNDFLPSIGLVFAILLGYTITLSRTRLNYALFISQMLLTVVYNSYQFIIAFYD